MRSKNYRRPSTNKPKPELRKTRRQAAHFSSTRLFIPYNGIKNHGIIGDRRSLALVSADGSIDWLCLPNADSPPVFSALLDARCGGFCRFGPRSLGQGTQCYREDSAVLETEWSFAEGNVIGIDAMLWPEDHRPPHKNSTRVLLRKLECKRGSVVCGLYLRGSYRFRQRRITLKGPHELVITLARGLQLSVWSNVPLVAVGGVVQAEFVLAAGESACIVLALTRQMLHWTENKVSSELAKVERYWTAWARRLRISHPHAAAIRRAALTVHLLTFAPQGSVLAAATTSLPERIGGGWNADYRLCWVRDASLSVGLLSRLGVQEDTRKYLDWICRRLNGSGPPLQVLYGLHGEHSPRQRALKRVPGYGNSTPVRLGNHAYKQHQIGSAGFLADCMWLYLTHGGKWRNEYWPLIQRSADFASAHWHERENGVWELPKRRHFVYSKVLCWVALDRALKISSRLDLSINREVWTRERDRIFVEVMEKGWSEKLGAFRQHYDADTLDAATLLISTLGFLPGRHPRVLSTIERLETSLSIDGWLYRFDPTLTEGLGPCPLGHLEGAFFLCNFWLATAHAKAGHIQAAQRILSRAAGVAGKLGLFSEGFDPRTGSFLGNTPLLFSHVEYARALLELNMHRTGTTHDFRQA